MKNSLKIFALFVCLFFVGSKAFAQTATFQMLYTAPAFGGPNSSNPATVTIFYSKTNQVGSLPPIVTTGLQSTITVTGTQTFNIASSTSGGTTFYDITGITVSYAGGVSGGTTFFNDVNSNPQTFYSLTWPVSHQLDIAKTTSSGSLTQYTFDIR